MIDRRLVLGLMSAAAMAPESAFSQQGNAVLKRAQTSTLDIAYEDSGPEGGFPVLLMHGFPYDPRCYDDVLPPLVAAGCRTIVPYLRGFGPTRFLSEQAPRSGQQAALGHDLLELMDALRLPRAWRQRRQHRNQLFDETFSLPEDAESLLKQQAVLMLLDEDSVQRGVKVLSIADASRLDRRERIEHRARTQGDACLAQGTGEVDDVLRQDAAACRFGL